MENSTMANFLLLILVFLSHSQLGLIISTNTQPNQDVSYMNFVRDANDFPENEEYEYIIIGGGTAGCPLAATLSKNSSVLVLERGSEPNKYPYVLKEEGLLNIFSGEDDGKNPAQPFISEDGVENIRGRVLGGSSMINGGVYSRANPEFFKTQGMKFDMEMVEKAYEWVEEALVSRPSLVPWQSAFKTGLLQAGVGPDNGFDLRDIVGTKIAGSIFDEQGNRHGAVELLNKADPTNLEVAIRATVQRIIFDNGSSASGVSYSDSKGKLHTAFIRKNGEIILSAGAIGSPQLLLLSGVGPKSHLSSLKLPVVLDQSHVGEFMSDYPRFGIPVVLPFQVLFSSSKVIGISKNNSYYFQSIASTSPFSIPPSFSLLPRNSTSANLSLATIGGKFSKVGSVGRLRLNSSTDAKKSPIVRFNYYSDPNDIALCVRGVRKIGDFLKTQTIENVKTKDLEGNKTIQFLGVPLPENLSNDSLVGEFCKRTVTTYWHYHGGCLVGKVVDSNYRVIGIKNLRVLDGSTFVNSPGSNPIATLMMLGRYVGLQMLRQRQRVQQNG